MSAIIQPSFTPVLLTAFYEIGSWNMDSTVTKAVALTGIDWHKVRDCKVIVINDTGNTYSDLTSYGSSLTGNYTINGVGGGSVNCTRVTGGLYDSTSYNDAVMNRGWVKVEYEA